MEEKKLTETEFARKAIVALRTRSKEGRQYLGIHTRFSGFNEAWKTYFNSDPIEGVSKLVTSGAITGHVSKGGYTIGLPEDHPNLKAPAVVLAKILA